MSGKTLVSLSLRKKSRHRHVGLHVWELITRLQFDDWRHTIHHWKGNFHSFEMIFPQDQKSRYTPAKYELFYCSFVKPKQRYLADFKPRYHNKKGNLQYETYYKRKTKRKRPFSGKEKGGLTGSHSHKIALKKIMENSGAQCFLHRPPFAALFRTYHDNVNKHTQ